MKSTPSRLDLVGTPLRVAVLRRLADGDPASLSELAEAAGVHANTARPHVKALTQAGALVQETAPPGARGRPVIRYRLAADWRMPATDLQELAELLAALVSHLDPDPGRVERFGHDWGRFLAGRPGQQNLAADLPSAMSRLGFDARFDQRQVRLSMCPCPVVSPDHPELVCALASGVVDGMVSAAEGRRRVTGTSHDPRRRRCAVRIGRTASPSRGI